MATAPEPFVHAPTSASRALQSLARWVLSGLLGAGLLAGADMVVASRSRAGTLVSGFEFALAVGHTVALYLPVGIVTGLLFAGALMPLLGARWMVGVRARLGQPRGWLEPDPAGFGGGLAGLVALAAALMLGRTGYGYVATSVHREELAAWAIGGVTAAAVPFAVVVFAVAAPIFSLLARVVLRRVATLFTLALLLVLGSVAALVYYLDSNPEVRSAYGLPALLWAPLALVLFGVGAALVGRAFRGRSLRVHLFAALTAILVAGGALAVSANAYGSRNRVRSVVEQRTVLGRRLMRGYASLTDRDGDHHTWAFGGGDCDDGNPDIYPGARDVAGDDIDADCFAGDGSPEVEAHGDGHFGVRPSALAGRPNILVITVDALRRDHLASNGYTRDTSPELDRFLATAIHFDDVVPQSSRSLRSIPAMWTGLYASEIAFGPEYLWPALLDENHTLPELLASRGYRSSAIMATDYFERVSGFFQGFDDVLQADQPDPPRSWAVDQALPRLRTLSNSGSPFLMWVHLFNCHMPYLHDGTPSRYGGEPVDLYDTEIGLAGLEVQRLLDGLDALGRREDTIVVLASDHGEGFGEHGTFNHSTTLYEEEMVPILAFRVPGVASRRVEGLVGLLDMMPTLANLAGVPLDASVSGRSLVPFLAGDEGPSDERVVFAELLPDGIAPYDIKVVRRGHEKLLWWVRDGTFQYFDLETDPLERSDLSDERREEAEELLGTLRAWVARSARIENLNEAFVRAHTSRSPPTSMTRRHDLRYEGLFTVLGIELPERVYHPGETIPLTFHYRVDGETERDLFFIADLVAPPGVVLPAHFHAWHFPMHSRHHTDAWRRGTYLSDPTPIVIPLEVPAPVDIDLVLTVRDGDQSLEGTMDGRRAATFELATIRIEPRAAVAPEGASADGAAPDGGTPDAGRAEAPP